MGVSVAGTRLDLGQVFAVDESAPVSAIGQALVETGQFLMVRQLTNELVAHKEKIEFINNQVLN